MKLLHEFCIKTKIMNEKVKTNRKNIVGDFPVYYNINLYQNVILVFMINKEWVKGTY